MMADAITFDLGGFPPIAFQLASSEGLAPLPLPQSLPQPSPDAVRLFQTAMAEGESAPTQVKGWAGLETVEIVPVQSENPVNPVKEDVPVQPIEVNSDGLKKELHYRSAPRIAPESRLSNDVLHTVENPAHPVQTEVPAQPIERQLESGLVARREGEGMTEPAFAPIGVENTPRPENPVLPANEASQSTSLPQTGSEIREAAPISATAANPAPLRELNTVAGDAPVVPQAGELVSRGVAEGEVSRGDAETRRPVGGAVSQTGLTGFEKAVEPSETPRTGEVVTKPAFAPLGVDQTPHSENPVNLVNPVQKGLPTELNTVAVDEPIVPLREMEDGAVEAPAALPSAAQPTPLAAASEFPEVQQVSAAQSARTEAVVATVTRMVETVNQIVEAVAAEIAVSPTLASGNGDIRITLKPTVLDGSEIRLTAQSGELTVSIAPATPAAAALAAAALPRLETALAEHAPSFHHVAVVVATARKGKEK